MSGQGAGEPRAVGSGAIGEVGLRIARLAGVETTPALRACAAGLDPAAPADYRELAAIFALAWDAPRPMGVGLSGGQGTGKSTLARLLVAAFAHRRLRAAVLALDDYYLPRAERLELARRVHPLLATRGVPGTHEVSRLRGDLLALARPAVVEVPIFDKGLDDRAGTRRLEGPFDVVVLEGWCVGARAQDDAALAAPCNMLERDEDRDGAWRRFVNARLATQYSALWRELVSLVYLAAPDLAAVRRWRLEQEAALPPARRKDAAAIDRFVQHYERITLDMMESLPEVADWTVALAPDHAIAAVSRRASGGRAARP